MKVLGIYAFYPSPFEEAAIVISTEEPLVCGRAHEKSLVVN